MTEITGSESFVHLERDGASWVALLHGVHDFEPGQQLEALLDPDTSVRLRRGRPPASPRRRRREERTAWPASTSTTSPTPTLDRRQSPPGLCAEGVSMTWRQGGAYALLGPSGCGKTTLLNIISGLVTPSRGRILFDGSDVTHLPTQAAQHRPGVPVPGRLRHHDGRREPGLPAEEPRRAEAADRGAGGARSPQLLDLTPHARSARRRGSPPTRSRRSRSAAAWCAPTSPRSCSTSR